MHVVILKYSFKVSFTQYHNVYCRLMYCRRCVDFLYVTFARVLILSIAYAVCYMLCIIVEYRFWAAI